MLPINLPLPSRHMYLNTGWFKNFKILDNLWSFLNQNIPRLDWRWIEQSSQAIANLIWYGAGGLADLPDVALSLVGAKKCLKIYIIHLHPKF